MGVGAFVSLQAGQDWASSLFSNFCCRFRIQQVLKECASPFLGEGQVVVGFGAGSSVALSQVLPVLPQGQLWVFTDEYSQGADSY